MRPAARTCLVFRVLFVILARGAPDRLRPKMSSAGFDQAFLRPPRPISVGLRRMTTGRRAWQPWKRRGRRCLWELIGPPRIEEALLITTPNRFLTPSSGGSAGRRSVGRPRRRHRALSVRIPLVLKSVPLVAAPPPPPLLRQRAARLRATDSFSTGMNKASVNTRILALLIDAALYLSGVTMSPDLLPLPVLAGVPDVSGRKEKTQLVFVVLVSHPDRMPFPAKTSIAVGSARSRARPFPRPRSLRPSLFHAVLKMESHGRDDSRPRSISFAGSAASAVSSPPAAAVLVAPRCVSSARERGSTAPKCRRRSPASRVGVMLMLVLMRWRLRPPLVTMVFPAPRQWLLPFLPLPACRPVRPLVPEFLLTSSVACRWSAVRAMKASSQALRRSAPLVVVAAVARRPSVRPLVTGLLVLTPTMIRFSVVVPRAHRRLPVVLSRAFSHMPVRRLALIQWSLIL